MIITLSPAKILDFSTKPTTNRSTQPQYADNALEINNILKDISVTEIAQLMKINPKQAMDVYQYIQAFEMERTPQKQAAFAYNGIAYSGLDAATLNDSDWDFAQKHLVILTGLYGILRPLDIIKPYRLEMQTKLENNRGKDFYAYWSDTITEYFAQQMKADDNIWLNLSSNEYTKVVNKKGLPKGATIITPVFKEQTPQGYKQVIVYAKKARGMMARFAIQRKITDVNEIKLFDSEGYSFAPSLSDDKEWVFIR